MRRGTEVVGQHAFVLAIDDVDTSFEKGWPVLEALRKYLATPRLKIIMAGDLKLYNLLVRRQQWQQIGRDFVDVEKKIDQTRSYNDQIVNMVEILQDQYLIKIVRPENRFELRPLYSLTQAEIAFTRSDSLTGVGQNLHEFGVKERVVTQRFARELLALHADEDIGAVRAALLRLPLRSSLQVFAGAWALVSADSAPAQHQAGESARRHALEALASVSNTALMTLDLDGSELQDPDSDRVLAILAGWLVRKGDWASRSRFHPEGVDEIEDIARLRIAAQLVSVFRANSSAMIDYWLRICTVREKLDRGEIGSEQQQFFSHLGVSSGERSVQFVGRLAAWDQAKRRQLSRQIGLSGAVVPAGRIRKLDPPTYEIYGRVDGEAFRNEFLDIVEGADDAAKTQLIANLPIPVQKFHRTLINSGWDYRSKRRKEAGFIGSFSNSLSSLSEVVQGDGALIALLPASQIASGQGSENGVYSILRLIACVAELLHLDNSPSDTTVEVLADRISTWLAYQSELRSYPTPSLDSETIADEESGEEPLDDGEGEDSSGIARDFDGALAMSLAKWVRLVQTTGGLPPLSPITLSRIWTRFTYAHGNIVENLVHMKSRYLGVFMSRSIVALLHAIGLETLRADGGKLTKNVIGNPVTGSELFANLLNIIDSPGDLSKNPERNIRIFHVFFSCPLWGFFLARGDEDTGGIGGRNEASHVVFSEYINAAQNLNDEIDFSINYKHMYTALTVKFENLYAILNTIQIQSGKKGPPSPPSGNPKAPRSRNRSTAVSR